MDRKHHCSSLMRAVASNMLIWNGGNTVLEDISSRRRQHFKLTGCLQAKSEGARSNWDAALASKDRLLQQLEEKLEAEQSNCQQLRKGLAEAQHREEVASGRAEELAQAGGRGAALAGQGRGEASQGCLCQGSRLYPAPLTGTP